MKTATPGFTLTVIASGAVAAHSFVGFDGATAAAGAVAVGVAAFDAEDGDALAVVRGGSAVAIAGDDLTAGDAVEVGADGKAIPADTGAVVGYVAPGETAAAGDEVRILF